MIPAIRETDNATLLRDNSGHLQDWEEPEFYFTVSKAAPDVQPSGSYRAEWTVPYLEEQSSKVTVCESKDDFTGP